MGLKISWHCPFNASSWETRKRWGPLGIWRLHVQKGGKRDRYYTQNNSCSISFSSTIHVISRKFGFLFVYRIVLYNTIYIRTVYTSYWPKVWIWICCISNKVCAQSTYAFSLSSQLQKEIEKKLTEFLCVFRISKQVHWLNWHDFKWITGIFCVYFARGRAWHVRKSIKKKKFLSQLSSDCRFQFCY